MKTPLPFITDKVKRNVLISYKKQYGLEIFVETGTYYGETIDVMKEHFDKIYSIELSLDLFKKAKEKFTVEEFEEEMEDVWSSCVNKKTLDESPMAYKDKQIILDTIEETADIDFIMKPVYNFKGS